MAKYEIVVDYGKPFSIDCNSISEVKKELKRLEKQYEGNPDEYPYFDINVYEGKKDISKRFFKD